MIHKLTEAETKRLIEIELKGMDTTYAELLEKGVLRSKTLSRPNLNTSGLGARTANGTRIYGTNFGGPRI